jgi:hypothetical protein
LVIVYHRNQILKQPMYFVNRQILYETSGMVQQKIPQHPAAKRISIAIVDVIDVASFLGH